MRIDNLPSAEEFIIRPFDFHGEELTLINPVHIGTKWTTDNLHFRSSVWNKDGELVSAGFKKFFNLKENPDVSPWDGDLRNAKCIEKLDGSLLIVSKYKDNFIFRTRGSHTTEKHKNHFELDELKIGLQPLLNNMSGTISFLFEWVSPINQIVIKAEKPKLTLIGAVNHSDYSYRTQDELDSIASMYGLNRPEIYTFEDNEHMYSSIEKLEGSEGICLYYDNDQNIRKLKSNWYLKLHAFRFDCSLKSLANLYLSSGRLPESEYLSLIETQFDFECRVMAEPLVRKIYSAVIAPLYQQVDKALQFVSESSELDQKGFALEVMSKHKEVSDIAFRRRKGQDHQASVDKLIMNRIIDMSPEQQAAHAR